ncbi:ABC transporter [Caldanaerobacter subterraneus subsp. yonseiensis KB-1]|uniref:ABC transporter n=1 Tax=Caldanaerobacter subterraneus subsp. yonseiensis KB-1 TaxID=1388761 RepID=U5CL43_CALSX|nr:GldG family protein [Caldanaerobacter subterraneus]ERM90718.1 ABC transporter [Caldanaerobacter subterraneus subsp. yonseiensis KB-1]
MNNTRLKYGTNAFLMTAVLLAILILVNVVVAQNPVKWDFTKNKQYTLSDQTKQVLKNLKTDVTVYAFFKDGTTSKEMVKNLLDQYRNVTRKINIHFVDPDKEPAIAQKYGITDYDTVLFISGSGPSEKRQVVNSYDIFGFGNEPNTATFNGEQQFTQAIIDVTQPKKLKAYILQGHDELNSIDYLVTFKNALKGEGYNVEDLNIGQAGGIPEDTALLVIVNPRRDFSDKEMQALKAYFGKGGKAIIAMGAEYGPLTEKSVNELLSTWGVKFDNDAVVDPARNYFMDPLSPVPQYKFHTITNKLDLSNLYVVMPMTRSISYAEKPAENIKIEQLLSTSDKAWGKTNFSSKTMKFENGDIKGPLSLAVAVSDSKTGMKMVLVGSSMMFTDKIITLEADRDFLMNTANWLANKTTQISIRPKSLEFNQIFLTGKQAAVLFYTTVVIIPLVVWMIGGYMWYRRKTA